MPGSPGRELDDVQLRIALDRVKEEAIEELTDKNALLILNGYKEPLRGKRLTSKGKDYVFRMAGNGEPIKEIAYFLEMSVGRIYMLIDNNKSAVEAYKKDPYAVRSEMHFSQHIADLGDLLLESHASEVQFGRDEENLSDTEEAYKSTRGRTQSLNERGKQRARRMIRMTGFSLEKISQKFGVKSLTQIERSMFPEPDVAKLSTNGQTELTWYLIGKTQGSQEQVKAVTGLRRPDVARMLGITSTRRLPKETLLTDAFEKYFWNLHHLRTIDELSSAAGISKHSISFGIRRHLKRNLTNADGGFSDSARNFILARIHDRQPQSPAVLLGALGLPESDWLQAVADIEAISASDVLDCEKWKSDQLALSGEQKMEIRRYARNGHHLTYIRHLLAERKHYDQVTPLIEAVMKDELPFLTEFPSDAVSADSYGAETGEPPGVGHVDLPDEEQLQQWKDAILGAKKLADANQRDKLVELGLKRSGGVRNTSKGQFAIAFFDARSGARFAKHLLMVKDQAIALSKKNQPVAVMLGKRLPGSPSRELEGDALSDALRKVQDQAVPGRTTAQLYQMLDGIKDPLLGDMLVHKGSTRLTEDLAANKAPEMMAIKYVMGRGVPAFMKTHAEEIAAARRRLLADSVNPGASEKGPSRAGSVPGTGPPDVFTALSQIEGRSWTQGERFGFSASGEPPTYYTVQHDRATGSQVRVRRNQIHDSGLMPTPIDD